MKSCGVDPQNSRAGTAQTARGPLCKPLTNGYMRWFWIMVGLAGILSACANVSRFEKDALVAHGEFLNDSPEVLYYSIFIEGDRPVDLKKVDILLKLTPDASPLLLSKLRPESVARYLQKFTPPPQWPEHWRKKAMEAEAYSGGGFHITFKNDRPVSLGICSHCSEGREHRVIGAPDSHVFYALPLTERQLVDVIGPADREFKVDEVRYSR